MKIFVVSDTHFGHEKSLTFQNSVGRFRSIEDKDRFIIANWNSVVRDDDVVYHLGDVFLGGSKRAQRILRCLNGHKILVRGNHDAKSDNWYLNAGFSEVHRIIWLTSPTHPQTHRYVFTHVPLPYVQLQAIEQLGFIVKNYHGHLHAATDRAFTGNDVWDFPDRYFNASVEANGYTPTPIYL